MTCLDARERFSELVDERLDAADRAAVDTHLVGCDACRTELERFRATVTLVRSLAPARAPAGFAQRVLTAAGDTPRVQPARRRWIERLVFPLPVKLPLEAAAVLLVGVGVAYVFTHSPELQQATRVEAPAVVQEPRSVENMAPSSTPAPAAPPREGMTPAADSRADVQAPPPAPSATAPPAPTETPPAPPPAAIVPPPAQPKREPAGSAATAPALRAPAAPAPPAVAESQMERRQQAPGIGSMAPDAQQREAPARVLRDSARAKESDLASRAVAKAVAPPDLAGALVVPSRAAADTALRDLVTRHRGQVVATSVAGSTTTVEVRIPRDAFAAFVTGLDALGRWRPDRETPELPADVRVAIRLTE